ncbi:MAG: flagellar motor switch protein FliN [Fimbriimonadaceae bacterium]|nr:flagellar motor switch protein FliN [Fimbriimonadaceae bacterium]
MPDEPTPPEETAPEPDEAGGDAGELDQAAIDALLAGGGAPPAAEPAADLDQAAIDALLAGGGAPPAAEPAADLDQAAIDALLAGGGGEPAGELDQAAIDALLTGDATADAAAPSPSRGPDLLDQATLDALMAAGPKSNAPTPSRREPELDDSVVGAAAAPAAEPNMLDQSALDSLWAEAMAEGDANMGPPEPAAKPAAKPAAAPKWSPPDLGGGLPSSATDSQRKPSANSVGELDLLAEVVLILSAELGRTEMTIEEVLKLGPGSLIELDKLAGEPVELFVNDRCIARGEVVVVDDSFGVRITELGQ